MKKHSYPVTNIGSVSLLMTFIVLCLVIFATLALSGALGEYQYSRKIADYNADYYEASNAAMETFREIDGILHDAYGASPENYSLILEETLSGLEGVTADFTGAEPTLAYQVPVNDTQNLNVILTVSLSPAADEGYLRITAWQKVPAAEWNGDESVELITF